MSAATKAVLQNAYEYVFTTVPISAIQDEYYGVTKRFVVSLIDTATALLHIALYTSLVGAKLMILVFPHAVKLGKVVVDFHMTKLSRSDLILEGSSIAIIVTAFIFRERIQRTWRNILINVSAKSKVAAEAAPHVLFFAAAIAFAVLGRNFLLPLTHSAVMPVFTLILPMAETVRILFQVKNMGATAAQEAIKAKNLLWVIVGIYHALVTFGSLVPFSGSMLKYLPYAKEMVIVVMVWVQLSPVFARIVFDSVISKIMVKLCGLVPAGYGLEQPDNKTSTLVSVLKMMHLITDAQLAFLQALFQDSVATIIAVIFIFTPNPLATVGVVIIALLLPAFRTSAVVACAVGGSGTTSELAKLARPSSSNPRAAAKPAAGTQGSGASTSTAQSSVTNSVGVDNVLSTHWMRYWVCLSLLWSARIYMIKFWPSIMIVATLWLQHSFFQGSSRLTSFIVDAAKAIAERNKRIEMERSLFSPETTGRKEIGTPGTALVGSSNTATTPAPSRFSLAGLFSRTPAKGPSSGSGDVGGGAAAGAEKEEQLTPSGVGRLSYGKQGADSEERLERHANSRNDSEERADRKGDSSSGRSSRAEKGEPDHDAGTVGDGDSSRGPFSAPGEVHGTLAANTAVHRQNSERGGGHVGGGDPAADYQKIASAGRRSGGKRGGTKAD